MQAIKIIDASAPGGVYLYDAEADRHIGQIDQHSADYRVTNAGHQAGIMYYRVVGHREMDQVIGTRYGSEYQRTLSRLAS